MVVIICESLASSGCNLANCTPTSLKLIKLGVLTGFQSVDANRHSVVVACPVASALSEGMRMATLRAGATVGCRSR